MSESIKSQPWATDLKYDDNFMASSFYTNLSKFKDYTFTWLNELKQNKRAFAPYKVEENRDELFSFVKGVKPAKVLSLNSNYALFDDRLNNIARSFSTDNEQMKNHTFVELFFQATQRLVEEKLRMH